MQYVTLGNTGIKTAYLGFGGIPIQRYDAENTVKIIDRLEELGISYIDTARGYTVSETYLGAALKGRRDKFFLASKSMVRSYEGMKAEVETSLANLQTDYIDLYQLHSVGMPDMDVIFGEDGAYRALVEAKEAGKIGHIGFTTHKINVAEKLLSEYQGKVESFMFPYNIVERQGEDILKKCHEQGIFTIAMKPLAGGNLDNYDLALRFLAASDLIDIVIPGMGNVEEVNKNYEVLDNAAALSEEDLAEIEKIRKELGTSFCRRCGYCAPCTVGINITNALMFANYKKKYGLEGWVGPRWKSMEVHPSACVECGACEERCPYELPIRQMLKDAVKIMEG